MKLEFEGIVSEVQIWCETPVRTSTGVDGGERQSDLWVKEDTHSTRGGAQYNSDLTGHVGSSKGYLKSTRDFSRKKGSSVLPGLKMGQPNNVRILGPNILAQCLPVENTFRAGKIEPRPDPFLEEIVANEWSTSLESQVIACIEEHSVEENNREA